MIPQGALTVSTRHIIYAFTIVVLVTAAYSGTLASPFQFDDIVFINGNPMVTEGGPGSLDGHANIPDALSSTRHTRLTGYVTFRWNYLLDEYNPAGYHALNILIHVINCLLIYMIAWFVAVSPTLKASGLERMRHEAALAAALLFGLHPVQTQAVTYLSQRFASIAAMFSLAPLLMYLLFRLRGKTLYLLIATIFSALAMTSKENAFLMPLGIALMEAALFEGSLIKRATGLAPLVATMALVPIYKFMDAGPTIAEATSIPQSIDRMGYLITSIPVVATYLRLLVLPVGQNFDYDYPIYTSLAEPRVLAALALHAAIIAAAVAAYRRGGLWRLAAFAVGWFYLMLSIENSVVPLANVIFEHRIYLPSAFIFVALSLALFGNSPSAKPALTIIVALSLALGIATHARNAVWADDVTLWSDVVTKSPMKARPQNNLCDAYKKLGDLALAEPHCLRAVEFDPSMNAAHLNLGEIYELTGRSALAAGQYEIVLRDWTGAYQVGYRLGLIYRQLGMNDKAIHAYLRAIEARPDFHEAFFNLGNAYADTGQYALAEAAYSRALELNPGNKAYAHNLIAVRAMIKGVK